MDDPPANPHVAPPGKKYFRMSQSDRKSHSSERQLPSAFHPPLVNLKIRPGEPRDWVSAGALQNSLAPPRHRRITANESWVTGLNKTKEAAPQTTAVERGVGRGGGGASAAECEQRARPDPQPRALAGQLSSSAPSAREGAAPAAGRRSPDTARGPPPSRAPPSGSRPASWCQRRALWARAPQGPAASALSSLC